jgi:RNA polymerase sigma-70 factor, ECF subfamily
MAGDASIRRIKSVDAVCPLVLLVLERGAALHFACPDPAFDPFLLDTTTNTGDSEVVAALQRREESAFVALVSRYQASLIRLALIYAPSRAVAEEIVQDAWLGVIQGIDRFEGRASLKTWLFRILVNRARTRSEREGRTLPFSSLADEAERPGGPAVSADRFLGADHPEWAFHWSVPPSSWGASPEERLLQRETLALVARAIGTLPPGQRQVITLRDVDGLSSEEVCNVLEISETNQRVLLHRARSRVRGLLEEHMDAGKG